MNRDAEMPCPSDRFSADHDGFNKSLVQPTRLSFYPHLVLMMMAIVFTLYSAALTRRRRQCDIRSSRHLGFSC